VHGRSRGIISSRERVKGSESRQERREGRANRFEIVTWCMICSSVVFSLSASLGAERAFLRLERGKQNTRWWLAHDEIKEV
jgi:hypothetical protein